MKISHAWLKRYVPDLPSPAEVAACLTMSAFEVEGIEEKGGDTVLDIKVLPDRAHDCLSHQGVAREVAGLLDLALKIDDAPRLEPHPGVTARIDDHKASRRMVLARLSGVRVAESPEWLRERLTAIGARSVNSVVDILNYVMFSTGQPMHAYDASGLSGFPGELTLTARLSPGDETIHLLDGTEATTSAGDIVIADGSDARVAIGLAGIKGGASTKVTEMTTEIVLEAAHFDASSIRRSARRLGIRTDASARFEASLSPDLASQALALAVDLIRTESAGDEFAVTAYHDSYERPAGTFYLGVSLSEARSVLGVEIEDSEVEAIFTSKGFAWSKVDPRQTVTALAPRFLGVPYHYGASVTFDAPRSFDCSSFTAYLFAHAGVAIPRLSVEQFFASMPVADDDIRPGDLIFGKGGKPYHFPGAEDGIGHVGILMGDGTVIHASGRTENMKVIHEKLSDSESFTGDEFRGIRRILMVDEPRYVIEVPHWRLDLRIKEDLIEEIGRAYGYSRIPAVPLPQMAPAPSDEMRLRADALRAALASLGWSEVQTSSFAADGEKALENPLASDKSHLRPSLLPALMESAERNARIAELLGGGVVRIFEIGTVFMKDGEEIRLALAAADDSKKRAASKDALSEAAAMLTETFGARIASAGEPFEVPIASLSNSTEAYRYDGDRGVRYERFSPYPFIVRDIAVFIPEGGDHEEIPRIVARVAGPLLARHRLFDTFSKEIDGSQMTSYAYRFVFQSGEKTLTDEEANAIMDAAAQDIARTGWTIR